jgi:hypothetical protein
MSDSEYAKVYWPMFWTSDALDRLSQTYQKRERPGIFSIPGVLRVIDGFPPSYWAALKAVSKQLKQQESRPDFDYHDPSQLGQLIGDAVDETIIGHGPAWTVFVPEPAIATLGEENRTFLDKKILKPVKSSEVLEVSKTVAHWLLDDPEAAPGLLLPACVLRDLTIAKRHQAQLAFSGLFLDGAKENLQREIQAAPESKRDLKQRMIYTYDFLSSFEWQRVTSFATNWSDPDPANAFTKSWKRMDFDKLLELMNENELREASRLRRVLSYANANRLKPILEGVATKARSNPRVSAFVDIVQDGVGLLNPILSAAIDIFRKVPALIGTTPNDESPQIIHKKIPWRMSEAFMSMPVLGNPDLMNRTLYTNSWQET